jgi:hypothetical protein
VKRRRAVTTSPTVMALAARNALSDARTARSTLQQAIANSSAVQTRISWITCLTLLRAVGHVLAKVDGERSSWLKRASEEQFSAIRHNQFANLIFWEFIEAERNGLLKEYKSSIFESVADPEQPGRRRLVLTNILVGPDFFTPMEAVDAAIRWWNLYLAKVEDVADAYRSAEKKR